MTWPLLVVLAAIVGGAIAVRRFFPRTNRLGGGGVINLLASHYLSGRQSLCLVRLGRRAILLGVTPERITPVAEINDAEELADLVSAVERRRPNSFSSAFARFCARDHREKFADAVAEEKNVISTEKLAKAGGSIHNLLGRIRSLSQRGESAEPT
jgi:flagellar biogenesis protein FliO